MLAADPHVERALELVEATIKAWEAVHAYCLSAHEGYDKLFQAALIIEDSGFYKLPIDEVRKVLSGRSR